MKTTGYDPTRLNTKRVQDLLPKFMCQIQKKLAHRPEQLLNAWPKLIGERLALMTRAVAFEEGVLKIFVNNSSLYSLLVQQEKPRLLKLLREQFPSMLIRDLLFRMG